jgi:prepilin-type N-terminal cleavage/methylation domain-containing protein
MPALPASNSRETRGGFTVVELMVSIAILTVLVAMLAGIFHQVSTTWRLGEGNIERRRGARALTDYIGVELQGAMLPAEGGAVAPGKNNLQFLINPPAGQVPDECRNADAIFWQAPLATETSFGEIAEIGYFVRWIAPGIEAQKRGATASRPALCRFFVNPSVVETDPGTNAPKISRNKNYLIYTGSDPAAWLSPALLNEVASAKAPTYAGLFEENVLGLWIRAYGLGTDSADKTKAQELPRTFYSLPKTSTDTNVGYVYKRPYTDLTGKPATKDERFYLPARVQISIVQIDSHHVARLDPVASTVKALARLTTVRDAAEFMDQLRKNTSDKRLAALLPGLRIYATEVNLQNAR